MLEKKSEFYWSLVVVNKLLTLIFPLTDPPSGIDIKTGFHEFSCAVTSPYHLLCPHFTALVVRAVIRGHPTRLTVDRQKDRTPYLAQMPPRGNEQYSPAVIMARHCLRRDDGAAASTDTNDPQAVFQTWKRKEFAKWSLEKLPILPQLVDDWNEHGGEYGTTIRAIRKK